MVLFGGTVRMRALIGALPADRIAEFPRMQVFQAFVASKDGDLARGIRMFDSVASAHRDTGDPALARDLLAVGHLLGRYADRPVASGDLAQLYREIETLPAGDDIARAALLNTACLIALGTGDMPAALDACTRAVREMRRLGSVLGINYCLLHLGLTQLHLGERREAEATFHEAASMAEENFGADSGLKAISDVHLALALHARGDVAGTAERLLPALPQLESSDGWLDIYAEGYEVAIANALARGNKQDALELCERMQLTASRRGLARLGSLGLAFRARLTDAGAAPNEWTAGHWRTTPSAWREHHALGVTLVLKSLDSGRPSEALSVLDDLEEAARTGDRRRDLRRLAALRTAVEIRLEDSPRAMPVFMTSVDQAVQEDDIQYLVDCGAVLLPLLQQAWSWSREHWPSTRSRHVLASAATMLARASARGDAPSVLSARELEVLVELARGAPNKVIARILHMTENTVKFHLKNIFQKLQVRHRAEALHAARARGLLS
jgi:LuxR family maltose regulon positive regulatory protein